MFVSKVDPKSVEDDIKKKDKPNQPGDTVEKKILSSPKYSTSLSPNEIKALAAILSNPSKLKNTYLSTKWTKNIQLVEKDENKEKKKFKFLESKSVPSNKETIILEEEEIDEISIQSTLNQKSISIKLLITEIANDTSTKLGRELISPILSTFNMAPKFGLFHTALL
jgi:hypothetical protein